MPVALTLFMTEPGDTAAISITDVNQGWLGDCFVCAPIASLALQRPDYIQSMIRDNGNGTQSVRLYSDPSSRSASQMSNFRFAADNSTWVTVRDADLGPGMNSNNGGQLIVNGVQEIWPQVIENAIAQLAGGYNILSYGGDAAATMRELTGAPFSAILLAPSATVQPTAAQLKADLNAKNMVVFDTDMASGYGLISYHSYTLTSVDTLNGVDYAHFRNPWGYSDPEPIPISNLSKAFAFMEVGTVPALSAGLGSIALSPTINVITGNRDGGVTLAGTSTANSTITVSDTVGGVATILGTSVTSNTGAWSLTSHTPIKTAAINSFTISAQDTAGHSGSMGGQFLLASTGTDTLTGTAGKADVFAIMSFKGSDIIQGFETNAAVGSAHDVINLSGRGISSFNQLRPMISGVDTAVIGIGSGKTITLDHISASSLSAADFRFS